MGTAKADANNNGGSSNNANNGTSKSKTEEAD